jgi:alpha-L-fucosidase
MEQFSEKKMCTRKERLAWFRAAKFGMFIHWGLYSQLAGFWKGEEIPGIGEWIMHRASIPVEEYRKIAQDFNPQKFDADKWVKIAKDAGMRYIVITAKHHDGFAMYHSRCSPYNIVDATPFKRDPMKELAVACQKYGLRLCFYYSHKQDWEDPDGFTNRGHWDKTIPPVEKQIFERYMDRKALPQLVELLTGYGPIGIIWYDTPSDLSDYNARRFSNLVHAIQPECIVSPRVSSNSEIGDYIGYTDNLVPVQGSPLPWETCATMNDTWGFKSGDHNWKSTKHLIQLLVSIVSKGGNYLLNVGPTAKGEIPLESIDRLTAIGQWLEKNGEAIYSVSGCLLRNPPEWGAVTGREGKLYIHIFNWIPGEFILTGLSNQVKAAKILVTEETISFFQKKDAGSGLDILSLTLPQNAPDGIVSVIELDIIGLPQIDETPNDATGPVILSGFNAHIMSGNDMPELRIGVTGIPENWHDIGDYLQWDIRITHPGDYEAEIFTATEQHPERNLEHWEGGHEFTLSVTGSHTDFTVTERVRSYPRDNYLWQIIQSSCGKLHFDKPGNYTLKLKAQKLIFDKGFGPKVQSIMLSPVR